MRTTLGAAVLVAALAMGTTGAAAQQTFQEADGTGGGMGGQGQFGQQPIFPNQQGGQQGQWQQPGQQGQWQQPGQQQGFQQPGQQGQWQQPGMQQPGFQQPGGQQPGGQTGQWQQPGQQPGQQGQWQQPGQQQPGFQQQPGMQQPGVQQPGGQPNQGGQTPGGGGLPPEFAQMLDQMAQFERRDFGVPATDQLHQGAMHGPTPASIPGGQVITTKGLVELIQGRQTPFMIFDVLGSGETLPGAIPAVQASNPGSFDDQISQQMRQFLQQATQGNTQVPLIFYCASVECWMSYNASLRAIKLGYSNVLWYRGGIAAWKQIGGPTMPAGGGFQGGQPNQGGQGGQFNPGGQQPNQGGQFNQGGQGGQWNQGG